MKSFMIAATVASLGVALPARADVTVMDNNKTLEVDCAKDPQINLNGNHLTVTLKGVCATITVDGNQQTIRGSATAVRVNGDHNTVTLDAADQVAVYGNHNTVTVQRPLRATAVQISNPGTHNTVTRPK
jgi:hypothetical protein